MSKIQRKFLTIILAITTMLTSLLTVHASAYSDSSETMLQYRSREIKYTTSIDYPYTEDGWICYNSEAYEVLLYTYELCSSSEIDYFKDLYGDACTYETVKTYDKGYAFSYTPDGHIFNSSYMFEKAYSETGINGEQLYYSGIHGYVYYRGTTGALYTLKVYSKTKYYYKKYGEWGEWTSTPIDSTANLDVETRTLYKKRITFELNGGEGISQDYTFQYHTVQKPENPTKNGFAFLGWYKEPELITEWNFDADTVDDDITLYAKWGFDKNIVFFSNPEIKASRNEKITITPTYAVNDTSKAIVVKYKFDHNLLTYESISPNAHKYTSAKVVKIDSQYSYLQVTSQYDTSGYLSAQNFISPYDICFTVNNNANYTSTQVDIYDLSNAYVLTGNSTKVTFDVTYGLNINIIQSKVSRLTINGQDIISLPTKYTISAEPSDADSSVEWSVDNNDIAQITVDGILMPKADGTVEITATAIDGSNVSTTKLITIQNVTSYLNNIEYSSNCITTDFSFDKFSYQIPVESDASLVSFTPFFDDGLLICDGEFLFSGMDKTIEMTDGTVTVSMDFTMGSAIGSTYTLEFYKEKGSEYSLDYTNFVADADKISFDITTNVPNDLSGTIIVAWYDETTMIDSALYSPETTVNFSVNSDKIKYIKIMCWNMDTYCPLTKSIKIETIQE